MVNLLTTSTPSVILTNLNTDNILGTPAIKSTGGTFNFKISYINKSGTESELSKSLKVIVKP